MNENDYFEWAAQLPIEEVASLLAERDRLRSLVEEAYVEGWEDCHAFEHVHTKWLQSGALAALQDTSNE